MSRIILPSLRVLFIDTVVLMNCVILDVFQLCSVFPHFLVLLNDYAKNPLISDKSYILRLYCLVAGTFTGPLFYPNLLPLAPVT